MVNPMKHPLDVLQSFEDNFLMKNPTISLKTTKREIKDIKADFDRALTRMRLAFNFSLANAGMNEETAEKKAEKEQYNQLFKETRKELCMSLLTTDFKRKYYADLRRITGSTEFFDFIDEIFGKFSDKDAVKDAKRKLQDLSRNSEEEETFTRYYKSVEQLSKEASENCATLQKYFITETFNRCLTPELKRYLLDQGMNDKDAKTTAEYLDKKLKYKKKVEVRAISTQDILLEEKMNALTERFASIPQMIQSSMENSLTSLMKSKIETLEQELAEIKRIGRRDNDRKTPREESRYHDRPADDRQTSRYTQYQNYTAQGAHQKNTAQGAYNNNTAQGAYSNNTAQGAQKSNSNGTDERSWPINFEIGPGGFPYRCHKCGVLGHRSFNCRGTKLTCNICREVGHIQAACPQKKSKN